MYDSIILGITKFKTNAPWIQVSEATPVVRFEAEQTYLVASEGP